MAYEVLGTDAFDQTESSGAAITVPANTTMVIASMAGEFSPAGPYDIVFNIDSKASEKAISFSVFSDNNHTIAYMTNPSVGEQTLTWSVRNYIHIFLAYVRGLDLVSPVNDTSVGSESSNDGIGLIVDCEDGEFVWHSIASQANTSKWGLSSDVVVGEFVCNSGGSSGGYSIGVSPSINKGASNPGSDSEWSMAGASFKLAPAGSPKMILVMSKIWDRVQENRKKLGIGDLGNFGLSGGLWKPNQGLATI